MASAVAGPGSAQLPTTGAAATQESDGQTEKPGPKRGREGEAGAPLPQQGPKRIRVVNGFADGAGPKANGASASLPQVLSWKALSNADDLQITIMHKGRTFMGTVHFTAEVAAQMPALPLNLHQAKPAGAAAAPHKVADQKPHAQPQRQHLRQQRQAPPAHPLLAQAAREAVTPPPAVVAARGKQVPASLAQEDKDLAAQRLEALGPTSGSSANESGSEARRAQAEREFLRMEREGPPAGTKCMLCHRSALDALQKAMCTLCHRDALEAAREPQFEGRLRQGLGCLVCVRVTATQNTWVHEQCAFWSPEVYEQDYQFMDLGVAVRRGRLIKCKVCNSKGATLGCHVATCKNSAHLPCARFKKWLMDPDSGVVTCSTHQPGIARSSRALRRTGSSQQADEEHTPPAEETGDNVARSGSGRGQSWSGGATAVGTHQGEQAGPPPVVLGRTQAVSAAPSGGQARASEQAEDGVAADRDISPDQDWKITMTPTLDTKLVNMPPHNFDPAEVPDADMCEFLGGSMGTPGTRRGSPGICRICIVTRQGNSLSATTTFWGMRSLSNKANLRAGPLSNEAGVYVGPWHATASAVPQALPWPPGLSNRQFPKKEAAQQCPKLLPGHLKGGWALMSPHSWPGKLLLPPNIQAAGQRVYRQPMGELRSMFGQAQERRGEHGKHN
eukprot:jgi/Astpho2/8259/Aster-x1506